MAYTDRRSHPWGSTQVYPWTGLNKHCFRCDGISNSKKTPIPRVLQFPALFGGLREWNRHTNLMIGTFFAVAMWSYTTQLYFERLFFAISSPAFVLFQKDRVVYPPFTTVFTRGALLDRRKDESRSFTHTNAFLQKAYLSRSATIEGSWIGCTPTREWVVPFPLGLDMRIWNLNEGLTRTDQRPLSSKGIRPLLE